MIHGFQHVGLGVNHARESYSFYKKFLGFRVKLNDHEEELAQMEPIIGSVERMHVIMAMNLSGGAAVELVQHTSSQPRTAPGGINWCDIGYLSIGVRAYLIEELIETLSRKGLVLETPIVEIPAVKGGTYKTAFLKDPDGILVELLETPQSRFGAKKPRIGGFTHLTIGVTDIEKSRDFYSRVMGFDSVVWETDGCPYEFKDLKGRGGYKEIMLERLKYAPGALPLEGGTVRLVQVANGKGKIVYEGRRWGDVGIMEMAFDVTDIKGSVDEMVEKGARLLCEPTKIDMGSGSVGSFAYVKDPDENIIELVEVEKLAFLSPTLIAPVLKLALAVRSRI